MLSDRGIETRPSQQIERHSLDELQRWYPEDREGGEANTFEIGLVLAGAVSAGAYTAGVMDFLFEALDEWYRLRKDDNSLPTHNVILRVISGASAGGINGAIAATACRYSFPPVTLFSASQGASSNPFFNTWVKGIDIGRLLDPSDILPRTPIRSILNSKCLDDLAKEIVGHNATNPSPGQRDWLADPFKLFLTVTNLRGVPYGVRFSNNTDFDHEMMMHRDHMGFSVPMSSRQAHTTPAPDLVPLPYTNSTQDPAWMLLATTALASSAFPFALATRILSRPGSDYEYRYSYPYGPAGLVYSKPRINTAKSYCFAAIDGGTMNNEPFELARRELAGSKKRNPRSGQTAHRAIIMVDPFPELQEAPPVPDDSLRGTFSTLFPALVAQNRFKQIDLTLAEAEDVYSRFLIAPRRSDCKGKRFFGSKAIASGGLSGFLGFFSEDYRMHDYMLGRENCQRFLRDWFVLPSRQMNSGRCLNGDNRLFQHWPQAALSNPDFRSQSSLRGNHRQIIPLVGTAATPQTLDEWPKNKFEGYESLEQQIKERVDRLRGPLADEIAHAFQLKRWVTGVAIWLAWNTFLRRRVLKKLKKWIDGARDRVDNS